MTFAERRRVVLAVAITIVGVIALSLSRGSSQGDAASGSSGRGPSPSSQSNVPGAGSPYAQTTDDAPADPAFLPEVDPSTAPQIITVNVPAPPAGTVIRGTASYIRWPQTLGLRPCATPHALIGAVITVTNLNNGRQIKCNNVSIEALRDGSVIILHTDVFMELADLVDAPIPVEINF